MTEKVLRWISFSLEALLAIPVLGGAIILGLVWTPLVLMFILHLVTLILSPKKAGSIVGLIASVLGWIPILGWALHLAAAITLLVQLVRK